MAEKQNIDERVDEKIDDKILAAGGIPPAADHQGIHSTQGGGLNLDTAENVAAKTTAEQDRKSAGQRGINETWEDTQKKIALFAVCLTMMVSAAVIVASLFGVVDDTSVLIIAAFTFMSSTTSLIVGFYFSRTNHARIGDDDSKNKRTGLDDR